MYIIVEGMPASGKSTLAKKIAEKYKMLYFKSLLTNDKYGNILRNFRDNSSNEELVDLAHLIDLMRNEIQISSTINKTNVVRDKCFLSSLAHFECVKKNLAEDVQIIISKTYDEIYSQMIKPDLIVLIDRPYEECVMLSHKKDDKSAIDDTILGNCNRFEKQRLYLLDSAKKYFSNKLLILSTQEEINCAMYEIQKFLRGDNNC